MNRLIKELAFFRSKLTAVRVGLEFIPVMQTEIIRTSSPDLSWDFVEMLIKDFIEKDKDTQKTLELLRQFAKNDVVLSSHKEYPDTPFTAFQYNPEPVVRDYVENKSLWKAIFRDIQLDKIFNSWILKIYAINIIEKTAGSKTPGVDEKCFRSKIKWILSQNVAEQIKDLSVKHPAKRIMSLVKYSNNLAIQRKGYVITSDEKLKIALKHSDIGKVFVQLARLELRAMKKSPGKYVVEHNKMVHKLNTKLKYELLQKLKFSAIQRYKPQESLKITIPKAYGKLKPFIIPTIYDRTLHKFVLIIMEPYMEPTGDRNS